MEWIQVWILLGYPINTGNFTSKRKLGRFPPSTRPPTQNLSFLILMSQKILLLIKEVKLDFGMSCILVLFPFL